MTVDRGKDSRGYYARLGVPETATAAEIKRAFRRRAKDVHPDHNTGADAKDAFQRLNEAYRLLSDPAARARYDAGPAVAVQPPSRPGTTASAAQAPRTRAAPSGIEPILCCRCGTVTVQPRYATFRRVLSFVIVTRVQPIQGVFCRPCADRQGLMASAVTWLLGWWALPWGPVRTVQALWRNLLGGERPGDLAEGHGGQRFLAQERQQG